MYDRKKIRSAQNVTNVSFFVVLPSDILDLCCSCMDMLSALRLAACSRDMHTTIIKARPKLFKTPCLLLSGLARLAHNDTEARMMPLNFNPISISRNSFAGM